MIDVQVERPVVIKANGKTIKLSGEDARELARKLNDALGISMSPIVWPSPVYYTDPVGNDWRCYINLPPVPDPSIPPVEGVEVSHAI